MDGYIDSANMDAATAEWFSNPTNVAAIFNQLRHRFQEAADEDAPVVRLYDYQVYAAIGRIMGERREYSRSLQERRTDAFMSAIAIPYLEHGGYPAQLRVDPEATSTGRMHRYINVTLV